VTRYGTEQTGIHINEAEQHFRWTLLLGIHAIRALCGPGPVGGFSCNIKRTNLFTETTRI
jgi:hypothetical protein